MKLLLLAAFVVAATALPFADIFEDVLGKPDTKVGICPLIPRDTSFGICSTVCRLDRHCDGDKKCCSTPCGGAVCLDPVPEQQEPLKPVTTPEETVLSVEEQWVRFVQEKRETVRKLREFTTPPTFFQKLTNGTETLRFCTSTLCEWKKCTRMADTFTYSLKPRKEWACALATTPQHCMAWIEQGYADVMITRDEDVFVAKTKFNLTAVAYESTLTKKTPPSEWQNVTLAVARYTTNIQNWSDMRNRYSCHTAANDTASFKTPIGSLIQQGIIPRTGDYVESAAEFFRESCVPGLLNKTTINKNGTYPYSLEARCDHEDLITHGGIEGAVRCLRENRGDVMFVDHKTVQTLLREDPTETRYRLICKSGNQPLGEWETKDCHISKVPQPTVYISPKKIELRRVVQEILTQAVQTHSSKSVGVFKLFSSEEYTCPLAGPTRDLIFKDESNVFINIDETIKPHAAPFFTVMETVEKLIPKPTARICVTTVPMYERCRTFKGRFEQIESTRNIAWGCVRAESKMECMKTVLNGSAELMTANTDEIFTAGREFKLQPFLSQQFDTLTPQVGDKTKFENNTYTYTIGVIMKEKLFQKYGHEVRFLNMTGLKTCHAGISKLSSFKHPIGWLLANGTIPRIGSVFESVSRFFDDTCLPGATPRNFTWDQDLVLGQELNWGYPGFSFFNFTGFEWFNMNAPNTWNYYNWKGMSPKFFNVFFKDMQKDEINEYVTKGGLARLPMLAKLLSAGPRSLRDLSRRIDQLPEEILGLGDELLTLRGQTGETKLGGSLDLLLQRLQARDQMKSRDWTSHKHSFQRTSQQVDPLLSALSDRLNSQRFNFEEQLSEVMEYINEAPSTIDYKMRESSWINHPAVKSFLQVYNRRFVNVDLFDNLEIREQEYNRYFNPLWLSPRIGGFLGTTKVHQEKLCKACAGVGVANCTETPEEPFSGFRGSLECLKQEGGDIAFLEAHNAREILREARLSESEIALVCRSGEVIDFTTNEDVLKRCSFGEVPYPAILTAYNKTGSWRWNVTKAFLEAQKQYNIKDLITDLDIQNPTSFKLQPVSLINQTYEVYLQPMLLRSLEALVKPSSYDWWKQDANVCHGETYTNVLTQRNGTCNAIVKDVTCTGTPTPIVMSVGRVGEKKKVLVPMCSRPTKFVRQMAEYTCETGATYLKTTMVPTACECVPCEEFTTQPSWNNDNFWQQPEHQYFHTHTEKIDNLWGNAEFWSDRTLTRNFDLTDAITDLKQTTRVGQTTTKTTPSCEKPWTGDMWQREWFPQQSSVPVCEQRGKTQAVKTIQAIIQMELEKEL
ncbi:major yolk protein-like [Asterias amurensis]|uniref:major yolk protein-like n=1 Tax=Asterias amurensis TaxID=7602 RepID=UPI003AB5F71C